MQRLFRHWKKIAIGGVLSVVLLCALAIVWIDWLAKVAIETAGTSALGVSTTLDTLHLGLARGDCNLAGLKIANPEGFKAAEFIKLDEGAVDISLGTLMHETIEISQLTLTGVHVNLIKEAQRANYRVIVDNVARFESGRDKPQEEVREKHQKKFIIHDIMIRDVNVFVDLLPFGGELTELNIPIPELHLENVGTDTPKGETLAKVTATIVKALLNAVLAKGESLLPPEMLEDLRDRLADLHPLETLRAWRQERLSGERPRLIQRDPGAVRARFQERRSRRLGNGSPQPPQPLQGQGDEPALTPTPSQWEEQPLDPTSGAPPPDEPSDEQIDPSGDNQTGDAAQSTPPPPDQPRPPRRLRSLLPRRRPAPPERP